MGCNEVQTPLVADVNKIDDWSQLQPDSLQSIPVNIKDALALQIVKKNSGLAALRKGVVWTRKKIIYIASFMQLSSL